MCDVEQSYDLGGQFQFLQFKRIIGTSINEDERHILVEFEIPYFNAEILSEACREIPSYSHLNFEFKIISDEEYESFNEKAKAIDMK